MAEFVSINGKWVPKTTETKVEAPKPEVKVEIKEEPKIIKPEVEERVQPRRARQ